MTLLESQLARLRGQVAWITGGKRIGRVVARALAEQGAGVIVGYRHSEAEALQTVTECRQLGVPAEAVQLDVASRESVQRAVDSLIAHFPEIHILVNMASVYRTVDLQAVTAQDWEQNVGAHVLGSFWPVQLLAPHMPSGSHIINVADACVTGRMRRRVLPYQVTKAAVAAMTRALAVEFAPQGIFVNAIAPGQILRPEDYPEHKWAALRSASPIKYPLSDEEAVAQFALLVLYLSVTTTCTGHTFPLDTGDNL